MKASLNYYDNALKLFEEKLSSSLSSTLSSSINDVIYDQILLTKATILFGSDEYEEAMDLFWLIISRGIIILIIFIVIIITFVEETRETTETVSTLSLLPRNSNDDEDHQQHHPYGSILELEETLLGVAVNNYCICCLYLRKLAVGIIIIHHYL